MPPTPRGSVPAVLAVFAAAGFVMGQALSRLPAVRDQLGAGPGDQVRVTCEHDQELRDLLPAFEGQPDRYVVWGEGSTDEMCLGILQVAHCSSPSIKPVPPVDPGNYSAKH